MIGGAEDERPFFRHAASLFYTGILRLVLGFRGTDTHGLKGFRRELLVPVVEACVVDKATCLASSEMVIRAYQSDHRVVEIPTRVMEKRPPSINLMKRVPNVLGKFLARLTWAVRVKG